MNFTCLGRKVHIVYWHPSFLSVDPYMGVLDRKSGLAQRSNCGTASGTFLPKPSKKIWCSSSWRKPAHASTSLPLLGIRIILTCPPRAEASLVRDKKTQRPRGMAFVSLAPKAPEAGRRRGLARPRQDATKVEMIGEGAVLTLLCMNE